MGAEKTLRLLLSGAADAAIRFDDLCQLLESLGFEKRVKGKPSSVPQEWRRGEDQLAEGGCAGEAVPGEAGPVRYSESEAGFPTMIKYEVIIYWSDEDGAFVAEVPELPGCMAHGATQEAALGNAQDAIRLWIDTAKEFGDPIPEPKGRRLVLA
jgi:predicted RNase H-like HicB family nuclease